MAANSISDEHGIPRVLVFVEFLFGCGDKFSRHNSLPFSIGAFKSRRRRRWYRSARTSVKATTTTTTTSTVGCATVVSGADHNEKYANVVTGFRCRLSSLNLSFNSNFAWLYVYLCPRASVLVVVAVVVVAVAVLVVDVGV